MDKIPKKIHYCWFGGKELPPLAIKCLNSWKEKLPDYEICRWDESNFDLFSNLYVREAYENKKWAFITDYARLYILYNHGGIYMDTDVEILKTLDDLLFENAFSGFEHNENIPTGIMASKKDNKWIKLLLDYYDDRHFIVDDKIDLTTNVVIITNLTKEKYHIRQNNTLQRFDDFTIYPSDYFCPKNIITDEIIITENTYCIHHFSGSWLSSSMKIKVKIFKIYKKIFGKENAVKLHNFYNKIRK